MNADRPNADRPNAHRPADEPDGRDVREQVVDVVEVDDEVSPNNDDAEPAAVKDDRWFPL